MTGQPTFPPNIPTLQKQWLDFWPYRRETKGFSEALIIRPAISTGGGRLISHETKGEEIVFKPSFPEAVVLISFVSVMVTTFVARNIHDVYLNDVASAKVHVKGS